MKVRSLAALAGIALGLSLSAVTPGAVPADKVFVTNANDSGPGSFREAVLQASIPGNENIRRIQFTGNGLIIELLSTVSFDGTQDLVIDGHGATLDAEDLVIDGPAFQTTAGGDITLNELTVRNSDDEGIAILIPGTAAGTINVSLFKVTIEDNLGHGVLVDDQVGNSPASLNVSVTQTRLLRNGFGEIDKDGLRVNEGGPGDLRITIRHTLSQDNGADGFEADEKGAGDVHVDMFQSDVVGNGSFTTADLDDGFDIDEDGSGSIFGIVAHSRAIDNHEEGFDFNELDTGDLKVDFSHVVANGNGEEGVDLEEDDECVASPAICGTWSGDLVTRVEHLVANDNGSAGLRIREGLAGNVDAVVSLVETIGNVSRGIRVEEEEGGDLVAAVSRATSRMNTTLGMDFDENAAGDLTVTVDRSTASNNLTFGLRADEASTGVGTFTLTKVTLAGNASGQTTGNVVPTILP